MVKASSLLHLGTAIALSLLVAAATTRLIAASPKADSPTPVVKPSARMAVAARDLPRGTRLAPAMMKTAFLDGEHAPAGSVEDGKAFEGWIVTNPIAAGEPLTGDKLSLAGVGGLVSPGKRAMSIKASRVRGLGEIAPAGSMADVLVTLDAAGPDDRKITKLVLENIPVLMVEEEIDAAPKRSGKDESNTTVVYTLELTPEESEKLAHATAHGEIHFALRNPADSRTVFTEGADYGTMVSSYRQEKKASPARRQGAPTRPAFVSEAIRGMKLEKGAVGP